MDESIRDHVMPEMTVAGSILIDEEGFGKVADLLKPEDFRLDYCRAIFEGAKELYLAGEKTDAMLIKDKAKDRLTGEQFIQLMELTPTAQNIVEYAKLTVQNARDRALRELCQEVLSDRAEDVDVLLAKVTKAVLALEERKPKPDIISSSLALSDLISAIQDRQEGNRVVRSTGLPSLDEPLGGGLAPGSLYVLAGRPGMGKSTLALYLADQMAKEGPVLYISLEMTPEQLTAKRVARLTGIPAQRLLTDHKPESLWANDWDKIAEASVSLAKSQLVVNQSFSLTTDDILRMARQQKDLQAIVVDHLGLLQSATGRFLGRTELVTEISGALKRMALTLNVPVLALSQLNRAGETGANQRPKLSHLRDSGSIEQDADVVMLLHREDYGMADFGPSLLHVNLAKNRFGGNADVALNVFLAYDQVTDLSAKPEQ